jgi:hypothetical protein
MAPASLADVPRWVHSDVIKHRPVGSSNIPGVQANDRDLLLLVNDRLDFVNTCVEEFGWTYECGKDPGDKYPAADGSTFSSLRKGQVNLIVTSLPHFYRGFSIGAAICEFFRVSRRPVRVFIHKVTIALWSPVL